LGGGVAASSSFGGGGGKYVSRKVFIFRIMHVIRFWSKTNWHGETFLNSNMGLLLNLLVNFFTGATDALKRDGMNAICSSVAFSVLLKKLPLYAPFLWPVR
jgi:hypothetical protein